MYYLKTMCFQVSWTSNFNVKIFVLNFVNISRVKIHILVYFAARIIVAIVAYFVTLNVFKLKQFNENFILVTICFLTNSSTIKLTFKVCFQAIMFKHVVVLNYLKIFRVVNI